MVDPVSYDFTIYQGATFRKRVRLQQLNDDNGWEPMDLTGKTVRMQVRRAFGETLLIGLTEGDGITIDDDDGAMTFEISAQDTAELDFNEALYDVELVSGTEVDRILRGHIFVSKEITE